MMEDADESSNENNIAVSGIVDHNASPQKTNKKAYEFTLTKDVGSNHYRSRIGFNLHPLPIGYHTLIVEFFPSELADFSMTALATSISIHSQTTAKFGPTSDVVGYSKTLIHFDRWNSAPAQYIYLDLHGTANHVREQHGNEPREIAKKLRVLRMCSNRVDCLIFEIFLFGTLSQN